MVESLGQWGGGAARVGDFTDPGELANSALTTAKVKFKLVGDYVVHGRITDQDGGSRDLFTNVHIFKSGNGGVINVR